MLLIRQERQGTVVIACSLAEYLLNDGAKMTAHLCSKCAHLMLCVRALVHHACMTRYIPGVLQPTLLKSEMLLAEPWYSL